MSKKFDTKHQIEIYNESFSTKKRKHTTMNNVLHRTQQHVNKLKQNYFITSKGGEDYSSSEVK